MSVDELNRQFGIPGVAAFEEGEGGLTKIVMSAQGSVAEVYLLGGHVTSCTPAGGKDVLWLSRESQYMIGQPIRGGIPVCHLYRIQEKNTLYCHDHQQTKKHGINLQRLL